MSQNPNKPALRQVTCLLLASVGLGLASNALNPAGIRWGTGNSGHESGQKDDANAKGIYRNETLYQNESVPHWPSTRNVQVANQKLPTKPSVISTGATTPRRSTWAEVKPLVESGHIVLVDARPRTAFDAGHIPGAVCLPFTSLQTEIQTFMATHPPTTPLAIYCANANCGTSSQMAAALTQRYKCKDVRYLPGGYQEWRNAEGK